MGTYNADNAITLRMIMNPATMTGLEIMQAFAAGKIPRAPISETIPMDPDTVEEGRVIFIANPGQASHQPAGRGTWWFCGHRIGLGHRLRHPHRTGCRRELRHHGPEHQDVPATDLRQGLPGGRESN